MIGVVITLSPGFKSSANAFKCSAAVPFETATAYLDPTYSAKASSNSLIVGPCVNQSDFNTSTTA